MFDVSGIKFDKNGLVPAIAQDYLTGEVLMMAYMNKEALEKTLSTGRAHYFSRSRNKLWLKGEASGNFQEVKAVYYDCDEDAILLKINQIGVACHTGERSCFFRRLDKESREPAPAGFKQGSEVKRQEFLDLKEAERWFASWGVQVKSQEPAELKILSELFETIKQRKTASPEKSYVASLYAKGLDKILEKLQEESGELIDAAKGGKKQEIIHETADLLFHAFVLLGQKQISLQDILNELKKRSGISGIEEKASRKKT